MKSELERSAATIVKLNEELRRVRSRLYEIERHPCDDVDAWRVLELEQQNEDLRLDVDLKSSAISKYSADLHSAQNELAVIKATASSVCQRVGVKDLSEIVIAVDVLKSTIDERISAVVEQLETAADRVSRSMRAYPTAKRVKK